MQKKSRFLLLTLRMYIQNGHMTPTRKPWFLLSRHGQALILLASNPHIRIIDLAQKLDISERSARLLVGSLHRSNLLHIQKIGRNNTYEVNFTARAPNNLEKQIPIETILNLASHFPT